MQNLISIENLKDYPQNEILYFIVWGSGEPIEANEKGHGWEKIKGIQIDEGDTIMIV